MISDDITIGKMLTRRQALSALTRTGAGLAFGTSILSLVHAAEQEKTRQSVKLVATPALTEGPFFVDDTLNRNNLLGDTSRPSVVSGAPLELKLRVLRINRDNQLIPLEKAVIDVWHADAEGVYSDEDNPMNAEDTSGQQWLRGYQLSDPKGEVQFKTIIPGWYRGRTAHIHFKIRIGRGADHQEFTSQLFFDDGFTDTVFTKAPYMKRGPNEVRNRSDGIYLERQPDGTSAGEHLMLHPVSSGSSGYRSDFVIALTDPSFSIGHDQAGW